MSDRIELGEIEAVLRGCELVREAVIVREDSPDGARLVAYVVPSAPLDVSHLRSVLATKLPASMVPDAIVVVDALPLTPDLTVDREASQAPDVSSVATDFVAPTNPVEQAIAEIWKEILGVPRVGSRDDFFALGGTSLLAIRVVSRLRDALGVDVPVREVHAAPTLAAFARATSARLGSAARASRRASMREVFTEVRSTTEVTRATATQEYFWYLGQADPDPAAYAMQIVLILEGPLDSEVFQRSAEAVVARHSIFRTAFREIDGKLFHQVSSDVRRFELEIRNAAPLPESEWPAEFDRTVAELLPNVDLTSGSRICGRLTALAPDRHALVLLVHHAVADAASIGALRQELFARYRELRSGAQPQDRRPVQYIDYAEALDRFARTPTGRAQREWWRSNLHGAKPLMLPVDFPREDHDARRAAAPLGITPDRMHYPYFHRPLPTAARDNVVRVAREASTTPYVVYLSALGWLFHQLTGENDICIENAFSERAHHRDLELVQGPITTWTMMRLDTSGCETLRDAIAKTVHVVGAAAEHGVISEYYDLVPHSIRRAIFNYVPPRRASAKALSGTPESELRIVAQQREFPRWKRPWELHLTILDYERTTQLFWTGIEELFRRETVAALLERYVDLLEHHLP